MTVVYRCDWCQTETTDLKEWIICNHVAEKGKGTFCSAECHIEALKERKVQNQGQPKRRRWWKRSRSL